MVDNNNDNNNNIRRGRRRRGLFVYDIVFLRLLFGVRNFFFFFLVAVTRKWSIISSSPPISLPSFDFRVVYLAIETTRSKDTITSTDSKSGGSKNMTFDICIVCVRIHVRYPPSLPSPPEFN